VGIMCICLYDLQNKAFDLVEYPVLLEKLYDIGVNGKMWRLLKSWYKGGSCQVKVDGRVSDRFMVERGVKQGLVLSPTLFLLVMDPLLRHNMSDIFTHPPDTIVYKSLQKYITGIFLS